MNLTTCILTQNSCYKANRKIQPKGVMVHSTGANNPTLKRYVQPTKGTATYDQLMKLIGTNIYDNDWNRPGIDVCVHAFIGKLADGSIGTLQTLPFDHRGWHAGNGTSGKSANDTHISFEICEDGLADPAYFAKVYQEAVDLTAYLCEEYNLSPLEDGVVICHCEGYQRGIASGHADVMHWFPNHGKNMDDFRIAVANKLRDKNMPIEDPKPAVWTPTIYKTLDDVPVYFKPTIEKLVDAGVLQGTDTNGTLNLSYDFCRTMTVLDRMGKL